MFKAVVNQCRKFYCQLKVLVPPTEDSHVVRLTDLNKLTNNAGHVKVRFTNLTHTGFVTDVGEVFSLRNATATIADAPTTLWSRAAVVAGINQYNGGFFIRGDTADDDRIRENIVPGQETRWRIAGQFSGKDPGNMGELRGYLTNPDSGFRVSESASLLAGVTDGDFTIEFTSIADENSLADGRGYQLGFVVSFDDENLTVTVNSIVRFDEATEVAYD